MSETAIPEESTAAAPALVESKGAASAPAESSGAASPVVVTQEFSARDRFHAMSFVKRLAGWPAELVEALHADLDALTHSGPVHVVLSSGGDVPYVIKPFDFVEV